MTPGLVPGRDPIAGRVAADEGGRTYRGPGLDQRIVDGSDAARLRDGYKECGAVERPVRNRDHIGDRADRPGGGDAPAGDAYAPDLDLPYHGVGCRTRNNEHRQCR